MIGDAEFRKENLTGVFEVEVALSGEVRYQAHSSECKFQARCTLKMQGTPAVVYSCSRRSKCKARSGRQIRTVSGYDWGLFLYY